MRRQNCIFDLYGTLVDIRTDEASPACGRAWRSFTAVTERFITPETAVMVGNDGVCDISGAQAVGLSTIHIRSSLSPDEPIPQAGHVVPTMDLQEVGKLPVPSAQLKKWKKNMKRM